MRVVIDTNCLLASIPPKSAHYWLYNAFNVQKFDWLVSNEILSEYSEMIEKIFSANTSNLVLNIFQSASNVVYKEPYFKWKLVTLDHDDDKFVDLAIAGNADYLVTNDKHFAPLKELTFPRLNIISLNEFKSIII